MSLGMICVPLAACPPLFSMPTALADKLPVAHSLAALFWQSPQLLPVVALLIAAIAVGVTMLYLAQTDQIPWNWRGTLLGLRLAALLALVVSILRPVVTRQPKPDEQGAVVVLVDHSHSMAIKDRQRSRAQLVALADGLGRLPPGARARGDELAAAVRDVQRLLEDVSKADSELTFAQISGRNPTDAAARLEAAAGLFEIKAAALVARRSTLDPRSPLAIALGNLDQRLKHNPNEPRLAGWIASRGAALEAVSSAAGAFQTNADERLYNNSPQVRAACDELSGLSRFELVEQAIVRPGTGLLANLPSGMPVYGFAIGDQVTAMPLRGGGQPARRLLLNTDASGMELRSAVRDALDALTGASVSAMVLLSDGRQPASDGSGRSWSPGVPIYPVAAAPLSESRDLSISHVAVPSGVYAGEPFVVRARVHGRGDLRNQPVDLRCTAGDQAISSALAYAPQPLAWAVARAGAEWLRFQPPAQHVPLTNGESPEIQFQMKIDQPGPQRITLRLPDLPKEITSENNVAERWVKVFPRKMKVTILSSAPTWDARYLRDALEAQAGADLHNQTLEEEGKCSISPQGIVEQNVLVLFDVAAASLDTSQWDAARKLVERGGLLVLVAGPNHLPLEYLSGPMTELLPYAIPSVASDAAAWHTWLGEDPVYRFVPTGDAQPLLRLAESRAEDQRAWASLTPLFRYLSLPDLKPGARPVLLERDTRKPVIAAMPLGSGQVLFVGLDETWRWRYKNGAGAAEQIWMRLLRELAETPYAAVAGRLSLDIEKAAVAPGHAVAVRAKYVQPDGSPIDDVALELRVLRDGVLVATQSLAPTVNGRYVASVAGLSAGSYLLEARAGKDAVSYPLRVVAQYEAELQDVSGDRKTLSALADVSGGQLLALEQLRQLPGLLAAAARESRPVELKLWNSSYLFVFVAACFAAEWALRKRLGLA